MRTVTVQFEFPDVYEPDEVVQTINGCIMDMDKTLGQNLTYTILARQ